MLGQIYLDDFNVRNTNTMYYFATKSCATDMLQPEHLSWTLLNETLAAPSINSFPRSEIPKSHSSILTKYRSTLNIHLWHSNCCSPVPPDRVYAGDYQARIPPWGIPAGGTANCYPPSQPPDCY